MITYENLMPEVVGQIPAKKKLSFYLNSFQKTRIMPHLLFCAPKGTGKSLLAKATAMNLYLFDESGNIQMKDDGVTPKKKPFVEINAASLKSISAFITNVIVPHVIDKDCTVFLDEAHNLKSDIIQSLLTMLNPNVTNKNCFVHDDYACDIDFSRQTFILASSEPHAIFEPLRDRLTRIDLSDYNHNELGEILQKAAPEVEFENDLLPEIATVLRGNARAAVMMAGNIRTYLAGKVKFMLDNWLELIDLLSIRPLGLNDTEIAILRFLKDNPDGSSLTRLAAKTGLSRAAVMSDYEMHLQKNNLMKIEQGRGRLITAQGLNYLKLVS